eukprot:3054125-Pyramimonas_sp.AAC.1
MRNNACNCRPHVECDNVSPHAFLPMPCFLMMLSNCTATPIMTSGTPLPAGRSAKRCTMSVAHHTHEHTRACGV